MVEFSCIVLAGGKSRRMGRDKRELMMGRKTFLQIAVEKAKKISSDVVLSLGDESQDKMDFEDVTIVIDEVKDSGPLFALASSLKSCKKDYTAILPLDAPLLEPRIYDRMALEIEKHPNVESVVPRSRMGLEPLTGIYQTQALLSACENVIKKGGERVLDAVSALVNVKSLDIDKFKSIDPKLLSFYNVNTQADLDRLMEKIDEDK
jgi:molybdopterin-guanine dinucleotide biosynthesis protein A